MRGRHLPVTLCMFFTLCSAVKPKVTEEDLILLSGDHDVPHCFSRNLDSVTCYWEAEELLLEAEELQLEAEELLTDTDAGGEDVPYRFYYSYDMESEECDLSVQTGPGRRTLYICEHDEVVLFNDLNVFVKDKMTNRTLRSRKFELELFALLQQPQDIKVAWEESTERFRVSWKPPEMDMNFMFKYEVQFWSTEEQHKSVIAEQMKEVLLPQLEPIHLYHIRVRTSWKGEKPSLWGRWSEAVTFNSLECAETIGFQCFTSDLSQVCCKWDEKIVDASFLEVHYKYGQESTSTWQPCEGSAHPRDCLCGFPARNDRSMSVTLNVKFVDGKGGLYYHKPFWISHVVLPPVPDLHIHRLPGNKLILNWSSPIPGLSQYLIYQIRFSTDNEKSWTTLQVPSGVLSKLISMVSDTSYTLQIRASPNQEDIQGFWSQWSARVSTISPSSTAWVTPVIIISILIFLAAVFCLPCVFPSFYRKLKDKLWPPLPNLHRVLDTFLAEIQKQYQPDSSLYEKPLEEGAQPSCLEILCELTLTNEGQQVSRDYVQLAPLSYQNEEYWPNLEPLELNPDLSANNQLPCGLTNQTYLPTVWSSP